MGNENRMALDGLTVLDVSGTVSTSFCARLFADYGARVINLESDNGFPTRREPPFLEGQSPPDNSALHAFLHTGKLSVREKSLDDRALDGLIEQAHLVLDDGAPVARLARACDSFSCVRMSVSWYGDAGPYADFVGSDAQIFALNGMLRGIGREEGPPIIPSGYQAQLAAGMTAYIGALGHVLGAELGNALGPLHLQTSILESALCFTEVGAVGYFNTGLQGDRMGINRFPPTYPLGVFPCRDGWLGVTVLTPQQWHAFCTLLEMEELAHVPLFQSAVGRLQSLDVIEPLMCERLLERSSSDLYRKGQQARIPLAPVPTVEELFTTDQFQHRKAFSNAEMTNGASVAVPSVPFRLFHTPPHFGGQVAGLGEHDGVVLP